MGFRFRKSKKIMPGVRLNFSKKGMGVSFGGKHARYSISPTGRRTTSFKVAPGLTYTTSSGGKKRKSTGKSHVTYATASYQLNQSPQKRIKKPVSFAEINAIVVSVFILMFILWILGILLNWNAALLKVILILMIALLVTLFILFAAFMLVKNIPYLKSLVLNFFRKDKEASIESPEKDIKTVEHAVNETKDIIQFIDGRNFNMFNQAIELFINEGQASTSVLQRKLKLGYARTARLMEEFEEMGVVSPCDSKGMRSVLITREMWEQKKIIIQQNNNQTENGRAGILDSPEKMEQYSAANSLRICRESIKIIYETTNPDTFFSRYEIILKETANIEAHSDKFNFGDLSPQTMRQEVVNGKQKYVRNMIDRYWDETVKGADTLKTYSGKKNRYQKFYDTLEQYKNEISEENISYYTAKYRSALSCLK